MSSNRHSSRFGGMLILAMAAFLRYQSPAICLNNADNLTDFHSSAVILSRL